MALASPFPDGRLAAEVDFTLRALHACWDLIRRTARPARDDRSEKPDHTPVTAVDFAVQAVILALMERAFPDAAFVAEEDGADLPERHAQAWLQAATRAVHDVRPEATAEDVQRWLGRRPEIGRRFWTIDPVDGTKGLLRGGQFATALALIEEGEVVLGGLACPRYEPLGAAGCLAIAVRGAGAWVAARPGGAWQRLAVSTDEDPGRRRLIRSVESSPGSDRRLAAIRSALGLDGDELRMDSQVKYLALAAGQGEVVVRLPRKGGRQSENTWDHAAGSLLAEEAGARVSDVFGVPLDFGLGVRLERNLGVVASVPSLHEMAIRAVQDVMRQSGVS